MERLRSVGQYEVGEIVELRRTIDTLMEENARLRDWHVAVDEALVCWDMVASDDPRESLNRLMIAERDTHYLSKAYATSAAVPVHPAEAPSGPDMSDDNEEYVNNLIRRATLGDELHSDVGRLLAANAALKAEAINLQLEASLARVQYASNSAVTAALKAEVEELRQRDRLISNQLERRADGMDPLAVHLRAEVERLNTELDFYRPG